MTKQELVNYFYKLDKNKFSLPEKGVAFQMIIRDRSGSFLHTGIGDGNEMTEMNLYALLGLYRSCKPGTTIEDYADSVRNLIIEAHKNGLIDIEDIEE